jgi:parvulin-like peptidyl-prolyl isomerase
VRVNDRVFNMSYFVKMLRLQGAETYVSYYTSGQISWDDLVKYITSVADTIRDNELVRQEAERRGLYPLDPTEVDNKLKEQFGFDSSKQTEEEFYTQLETNLASYHLTLDDLKKMYIEPAILQDKLKAAISQDSPQPHVQVQAMLLGTEETAWEVRGKWDEGFQQLVTEYSPSRYYPQDSEDWLPRGIESSTFDNFAFSGTEGISDPIRDTTYQTTGGYWLIRVTGERGEGEEKEWHIQGILLDSKRVAVELTDRINNGENFAQLAKDNSLDSASKENGGDMGWLKSDDVQSQFGADNLNAILALERNTLSEPIYNKDVSKQSGYWLIKVLAKEDRTLSFDHWLEQQRVKGKGEGMIKSYLDDTKISWALAHIGG